MAISLFRLLAAFRVSSLCANSARINPKHTLIPINAKTVQSASPHEKRIVWST